MFAPRTRPLRLDAARLLGLRLSLNTPVVNLSDLGPGPARAGIVVHEEETGPGLTVVVRSLRDGSVALYQLEGEERRVGDLDQALDAALCFGESMGFLFDDDELAPGGAEVRARALAHCRELLETALAESAAEAQAGHDAGSSAVGGAEGELLLDTLAEEPPLASAGAARATPSEPALPELALTKFRARRDPPPAIDRRQRKRPRVVRRAIGLVRLMRRTQRVEPPPSDFLQLLGQF